MPQEILTANPNPSSPAIPDKDGAPKSRIKNAYMVWEIAKEIDDQDSKRANKRSRIFKQYNRFPPTEYSLLAKEGMEWQSNVCFGMLSYVVDNSISSFFDMITERNLAADIKTKFGDPRERATYSDQISFAFDKVLREWDDFLLNQEQDLLDMHLYGKGIELKEENEGCFYEHVSADDFKLPAGTKINLCNFDVAILCKRYKISELWEKIENKPNNEVGGWNREAVLSAMYYCRKEWREKHKTYESFSKEIAEGNVNIASHLKENIDTYVVWVKEFDGKISKFVCLKDYGEIIESKKKDRNNNVEKGFEEDVIKNEELLFKKLRYNDKVEDFLHAFFDCSGTGMWHNIPSLAEKIFVQCRQYDFTMNAIMDAVKINMSMLLQGSTPEASDKIKALQFGPHVIIPSDVLFTQQRVQLPTQEATAAVQFMMLDMFRGIGEYRVSERTSQGEAVTATQNRNDTAEAARISGTQLKRYNEQHTKYYRKIYKSLVSLTRGEKDYEHREKFETYLKERKVPKEAWAYENIESINSNLLAGAGSPAQKMQAAQAIIGLLNISPKGAGQARAIEDGIAAAGGRNNVARYIEKVNPDPTFNQKLAGYENCLLADPFCSPADVQVNPGDDDLQHLATHMSDMDRTIMLLNENLDKKTLTKTLAEIGARKLLNQGGHVMAHMQQLSRDDSKKEYLKEINTHFNEIQQKSGELQKKMQAALAEEEAAKQNGTDVAQDPTIQLQIAKGQLELKQLQDKHELDIGYKAQKHAMALEADKDKTANEIAIDRVKATEEANKSVT